MSVRPLVSSPTDEGLLVTCWTNHQRNAAKPLTREVYYSERKKKKRPPNIRIMTSPCNDSRWKDGLNKSEVKSPNWEYHDDKTESKPENTKEMLPEEEKSNCLVITCCPWEKKNMEKRKVEKRVEITIEKKKKNESGTYKNYTDDDMQWEDVAKEENNKEQNVVKNGGTERKPDRLTHTRMILEQTAQHIEAEMQQQQQQQDYHQTEVKLMNEMNSEYSEIHAKNQALGFNNNHNGNGSVVHMRSNHGNTQIQQSNEVVDNVATTEKNMDLDGLLNLLEEQTESLEKSRTTLRRKSRKSEGGLSSGLAKSAGSLYTIEEQYDNQPTTYESNDEVFQGESPILTGGEDLYVDSARIRQTKIEQKRGDISKESSPELEDDFFDVPKFPLHLENASSVSTLTRYSMQPHQQNNRFHTYHRSDGQASRVNAVPSQFQSNPLYVYDKQYRGYHSTQTLNLGGQEYEELPDRASINSSMQHILDTDSIRSRHNSMSFGTQTGDEEGAVVVQHDLLSWGKDIDTQSVIDVSLNKKHSLQVNTRLQPPESRSSSTSPRTATSFYRAGFGVLDKSSSIHNRNVTVSLKNRTRCCLAEVDFTPDDRTRLTAKVGRVIGHKSQGTMQLTQDSVWDTIHYVAVYELQGMKTQLRDSWFLYTEFSWEGKMCEPVMTTGFFNAYYDQMHAAKSGETGHHLFRKIKMGSQRIKVSCKIKRGLAHADIELMVRQD
ncbi:hypothetical protein CAPTEDRAFT_196815 [Capitella teleta]|uniref:Uncharacterized protein n=1 Tax=Capitella teleta TaxID=283909 RepID=R7V596_CAPTE|nr:hypothetical protein CAPTEDRAFT_196815 [Capitella teleta]|eukprot:ELU10960.1 hypothetical protein CAPTEDRAFT_196815 [Capitella teleta]